MMKMRMMIHADKYADDSNGHKYLQIQPQKNHMKQQKVTSVTVFTLFSLPILSDFFSACRTSITPLKHTIPL